MLFVKSASLESEMQAWSEIFDGAFLETQATRKGTAKRLTWKEVMRTLETPEAWEIIQMEE